MIYVAGYCRVSTDQEDQANSFDAQQRYFREYIRGHPGWALYDIYADEGITGTSTKKRTQFNRMISDAYQRKFQLILTKEVSRFSRNILDTIAYTRELKAMGIGVQFMMDGINTLNPDAELYLAIMASMAQEESRKTSGRVVWGQTRQMEKGVVFGQSLLGYDVKNGKIRINPEGAETVKLIFQKYAVEQVCTSEIARLLTGKGCRTYRGSTGWTSAAIIKILKNEKYAGDLVQKKTYTPDYLTHEKKRNHGEVPLIRIPNHHEPIISRELWNMAQERLRRNNKHSEGGWGHSNRYVFSGKIKCGECGAGFIGGNRYCKDGIKVRRWTCGTAARKGAGACRIGKLVRDDDALQMLKTAIGSLRMDGNAIVDNVAFLASEAIVSENQARMESPEDICLQILRIEKKKVQVLERYFSGDITKAEMQSMKQRYGVELDALEKKRKCAEESEKAITDLHRLTAELRAALGSILRGETHSEVFSKTMLHSLTIYRDRHMELKLNDLPHIFCFKA